MAVRAGPVREISVRGRTFTLAADAECEVDLGGRKSTAEMNGDGTVRYVQEMKPWMISGAMVSIDTARGDQEFLQDVANGGEDSAISVTFQDGTVYAGTGTATSDIQFNPSKATASLELSGGQELTQQ